MSNILIIKHGSLGDIAQASGAIQDIFEINRDHKLYVMTSKPYFDLYKKNPVITDVILDKCKKLLIFRNSLTLVLCDDVDLKIKLAKRIIY